MKLDEAFEEMKELLKLLPNSIEEIDLNKVYIYEEYPKGFIPWSLYKDDFMVFLKSIGQIKEYEIKIKVKKTNEYDDDDTFLTFETITIYVRRY